MMIGYCVFVRVGFNVVSRALISGRWYLLSTCSICLMTPMNHAGMSYDPDEPCRYVWWFWQFLIIFSVYIQIAPLSGLQDFGVICLLVCGIFLKCLALYWSVAPNPSFWEMRLLFKSVQNPAPTKLQLDCTFRRNFQNVTEIDDNGIFCSLTVSRNYLFITFSSNASWEFATSSDRITGSSVLTLMWYCVL